VLLTKQEPRVRETKRRERNRETKRGRQGGREGGRKGGPTCHRLEKLRASTAVVEAMVPYAGGQVLGREGGRGREKEK